VPSPNASRRNLEKARERWRAPRPWRSEQETRVIKQIVGRWLLDRMSHCSRRKLAQRLGVSQAYLWKLSHRLVADPDTMFRLAQQQARRASQELIGISADGRLQRVQYLSTSWEFLFEKFGEAQERTRQLRSSGYLRTTFKGTWPRGSYSSPKPLGCVTAVPLLNSQPTKGSSGNWIYRPWRRFRRRARWS
jgi:transcriptional regulator with XRE-family HTH domain